MCEYSHTRAKALDDERALERCEGDGGGYYRLLRDAWIYSKAYTRHDITMQQGRTMQERRSIGPAITT